MVMEREHESIIKKFIVVVPCVISVAIILMMFLNVVNFSFYKGKVEASFTGMEVIFGLTKTTKGVNFITTTEILKFSIVGFMAIIFPVIASILQLFKNKYIKLVSFGFILAGIVLMFMMPSFIVYANTAAEAYYTIFNFNIGIGAIIAGILSCLEAVVILYELLS